MGTDRSPAVCAAAAAPTRALPSAPFLDFSRKDTAMGLQRELGLLWIMFAYSGWNTSAYVGSEARAPRLNLPRSLLLGTAAVTLLYLAMNLLFVFAVPPAELAGTPSAGGLAAARLFGRPFERAVSALIALALLSSLSAYVMLGPRVCFALARDGLFFRFAGRVHPSARVPSRSILFQGAFAAVLVLVGSFDQLLTYLGFALGVFPLLAVAGMFRLPRPLRRGAAPAACIFILASTAMLYLTLRQRPLESLVAIATLLLGVPAYYCFFRGNGAAGTGGRDPKRLGEGGDAGGSGGYFFLIGFSRWKVGTSSGSSKASGPWVMLGMVPSLTYPRRSTPAAAAERPWPRNSWPWGVGWR